MRKLFFMFVTTGGYNAFFYDWKKNFKHLQRERVYHATMIQNITGYAQGCVMLFSRAFLC